MSSTSTSAKGAAASSTSASTSRSNPKPKVSNPYAKKKSTTSLEASSSSSTNAPAVAKNASSIATNNSGSVTFNPYNRPKKRTNEETNATQQQLPPKKKSPPPVGKNTTFSQAFGDADPDAAFGKEERAEQLAFEESAASTTATTSSTDDTNNNSLNNGITARDHHTMLQPHVLHISTRQQGNPILAHIRNVPVKYSTMVPDYIMSPVRCALFLSLRYHNLHPNYIHRRIAELKSDFQYRMLLCYVDIEDNASPLLFLNDLCVQNNLTLILAWSEEEAARYLETVKAFDGKDDSLLKPKESTNHIDQVHDTLKGSVRSISKTDTVQLMTQFGTWRNMVKASADELSICPGIGPTKLRRLYDAFHRPFSKELAKKRREREKLKKEAKDEKSTSNTKDKEESITKGKK